MSDAAITQRSVAAPATGFYGKLPSLGDFVQAGLPRDFVRAWDGWISTVLPAAREHLRERWAATWKEAPVWRFLLAPGICGSRAALGVWIASIDRVGREFPLVLAAASADPLAGNEAGHFLAAAEQTGRAAVEGRIGSEAILAGLLAEPSGRHVPPPPRGEHDALWWTEGGRLVRPTLLYLPGLPDQKVFFSMLTDEAYR